MTHCCMKKDSADVVNVVSKSFEIVFCGQKPRVSGKKYPLYCQVEKKNDSANSIRAPKD